MVNHHTLQYNTILPDWSQNRILILDRSHRWATSIATQVAEFLNEDPLPNQNSISELIEDVVDAKSILLRAYQPNTRGLILFLSGLERECITLLGRLQRRSPQHYVLAIGTEQHHELLPTLLESGTDTVLFDVQNDIPVAKWCCRILRATATHSLPTL